MMEKMMTIGYPPSVGKLKDSEIARQSSWTIVPEGKRVEMSMHVIHVVPKNGSTCTYVNPLDPGDEDYYDPPHSWDKVFKTR